MATFLDLPEDLLEIVAGQLGARDYTSLHLASRFTFYALPALTILTVEAEDFTIIKGPPAPHWAPELWLESEPVVGSLVEIHCAVRQWGDQGWGNRKGELFLKIIRPGNEQPVYVQRQIFGIALHHPEPANFSATLSSDFVQAFRSGDRVQVHRNAGGGGGHVHNVEGFKMTIASRTVVR